MAEVGGCEEFLSRRGISTCIVMGRESPFEETG
jgi:hypothetical protein